MSKPLFKDIAIAFSNHVIKVCHELEFRKLRAISNQLIRSGTSVGAMVAEASEAESADDFIHAQGVAQDRVIIAQYTRKLKSIYQWDYDIY